MNALHLSIVCVENKVLKTVICMPGAGNQVAGKVFRKARCMTLLDAAPSVYIYDLQWTVYPVFTCCTACYCMHLYAANGEWAWAACPTGCGYAMNDKRACTIARAHRTFINGSDHLSRYLHSTVHSNVHGAKAETEFANAARMELGTGASWAGR